MDTMATPSEWSRRIVSTSIASDDSVAGEVEALGELEARNDEDIGLADRGGRDRETAGCYHPAAGRGDGDVVRRSVVGVGVGDVRGHGEQVGNAEDLGREASGIGQDSDAQRTRASTPSIRHVGEITLKHGDCADGSRRKCH